MKSQSSNLADEALSLPAPERIKIVEKLLASLDAPNAEINEIWAAESDSRVDAYENGEIFTLSMDEVLKKYR